MFILLGNEVCNRTTLNLLCLCPLRSFTPPSARGGRNSSRAVFRVLNQMGKLEVYRLWNKTGRSNVYSICSVWFKDLNLFRIWGLGLADMLNRQVGWSSPEIDSWEGRESGGRALPSREAPGTLVGSGGGSVVSGRRQSARLVRESSRLWGFALLSPRCALGTVVPTLACSGWPRRAPWQTLGIRRAAYLWAPGKTGEGANPHQALLLSATSAPQANALRSQNVSS